MFKLPDKFPTSKDDVYEIADSYECNCILSKDGSTPFHKVFRAASIADDELKANGIEDEDDEFNGERLDEVCKEISRREQACNGNYPFRLEERGRKLTLNSHEDDWATIVYIYLLFATRLNMQKNRVHAEIDGTLLFERFSVLVAENYWGSRTDGMVFGTAAADTDFPSKISDLCKKIGEGHGFKNRNKARPTAKDDKLDVVVWKNFSDNNPAKLIGFGQCKTGTSWEDTLSQLQPDVFCDCWFEDQPIVKPVRLFFIADTFPINSWYSKARSAGIIFDRFRIMDFLPPDRGGAVEEQVKKWVKDALKFAKATNLAPS